MEKPQLVNFIANLLEDSGFKVYKNFKTTQQIVDIYAILPSSMGDFGLVVACKNYDKEWTVGIDVLKEMEMVAKNLKASKVAVITSSKFSEQAKIYGEEKHIKLVDRNDLINAAKKYNEKKKAEKEQTEKINESIDNNELYYNSSESIYPSFNRYDDDEYYDEDIDYQTYDEYDDERYRAQYLNRNYHADLRRGGQQKSRTPLYSRGHAPQSKGSFGLSKSPNNINRQTKPKQPLSATLKPILRNPIVDVIIVVAVSYLISYGLGSVGKMPAGYLGLIEMVVALLIAYGLSFYADRDSPNILMKGTAIFFVSLIVLMILIVVT